MMETFVPKLAAILTFSAAIGTIRATGVGSVNPPIATPLAAQQAFYILPIWDDLTGNPDDAKIQPEIDRLKQQLGRSSEHFKLGFSFIFGGNSAQLLRLCKLAQKNDLALGIIVGGATHHVSPGSAIGKLVASDFRLCQWRLDGKSWRGYFHQSQGTLETSENPRDWMVPTPSRYAIAIHDEYEQAATKIASSVVPVLPQVPGVIGVVNFTIEEELAVGGTKDDAYLADYSPFAVTEFRDWLRHRGLYDVNGSYAGQGAPAAITGDYINVNGHAVSPFYDDPTPAAANGTGPSFNERFGTHFTTWDLAYWDLTRFPAPITDPNFDPSPKTGPGAIEGGFDAPRTRDKSAFWRAWSWDYLDQGTYPPDNPDHPTYGFRQCLTRNFVLDTGLALQRTGIPADLLFPHQIPGEFWNPARDRSSASTIWSGYLPFNGNLGITFFGGVKVPQMTQYSQRWGVFEWHPAPGADPQSAKLYQAGFDSLENYYEGHAHALFPGWWRKGGQLDKTFPLNDSQFAVAIKDWLALQQRREAQGLSGPGLADLRALNQKGQNSPDTAWRDIKVGDLTEPSLHQHPPFNGSWSQIDCHLALPFATAAQKLLFVADLGLQASAVKSDGVIFRLTVNGRTGYQQLIASDGQWHPMRVDLSQFAGQNITLTLSTNMNHNSIADAAAWGDPQVLLVDANAPQP